MKLRPYLQDMTPLFLGAGIVKYFKVISIPAIVMLEVKFCYYPENIVVRSSYAFHRVFLIETILV